GTSWRATARRGGVLQVTERHPERATDVVLFVDAFSETGAAEDSTLEMTVRAAATLARRYLGGRDRLGLVGFGGVLRWLEPGIGPRQLYRVGGALLHTRRTLSPARTGGHANPPRTPPPRPPVLAASPPPARPANWALAGRASPGCRGRVQGGRPRPLLGGAGAGGRPRPPPLAAAARGAARRALPHGRGHRLLVPRRAAGDGAPGGDRTTALGPHRLRRATG